MKKSKTKTKKKLKGDKTPPKWCTNARDAATNSDRPYQLHLGDALDVLSTIEANSIDALITDPPAGISFMGKAWDSDKGGRGEWISWLESVMRECLRVMKPGAHGLVWAIPRTSHWTGTALEQAGFEVRDVVTHLFGSGFPKSLDVSKAIDKAAGAERERGPIKRGGERLARLKDGRRDGEGRWGDETNRNPYTSIPATPEAKEWEGFGTALKPSAEFWFLVRKPLSEKTVAANVLKWGTGALNIGECRIGTDPIKTCGKKQMYGTGKSNNGKPYIIDNRSIPDSFHQGRFPANLVLSCNPECTDDKHAPECAAAMLDGQSGNSKSNLRPPTGKPTYTGSDKDSNAMRASSTLDTTLRGHTDSGGASRFFYCAKPSVWERDAGLRKSKRKKVNDGRNTPIDNPFQRGETLRKNVHPTVKPFALMRYLIKLATPPGGVVLDPFMGSGTTGAVAVACRYKFEGIELEPEFFELAEKRIGDVKWADEPPKQDEFDFY